MKTVLKISSFILLLLLADACRKDEHLPEPTALGTVTVDMDARENVIRKKESVIGNLICDAIFNNVVSKGKLIDCAVVNAGSIRYSASKRPNGIYPSGIITAEMIDEMLPFGDPTVLIKLNGKDLKSVFERSVAQYPLTKGPFLQLSKELEITIDTNQSPQVINIEGTVIISPGNRITSVKIQEAMLDSNTVYTVAFPAFIADGNDGYVTLKNISSSMKENLQENQSNAIKEYIILNTPVTPLIENRIKFQ
ncbi:MAG: 5-Nucleotidase protein [Bacteroidetes bacterium]|jgi:2',3'-cyclic-nucleotide 2'-phosphodiesterase (5'-nucleotidase family)|nr:5-Nucleotidase protein [Bacteroidota bacterium]